MAILFSGHTAAQYYNQQKLYHANQNNLSIRFHEYSQNELLSLENLITKNVNSDVKMDSLITTSITGDGMKVLFEYDQKSKLSSWLIQFNTNNEWENSSMTSNSYDKNGKLVTKLYLDWGGSSWDSTSRIIYKYDEQDNLIQDVFQSYSGNDWIDLSRTIYKSYNSSGNADTVIDETWHNNLWEEKELINFFYSVQNRKDSIIFYIWNGSAWQNDFKTIFYYNGTQTGLDSIVSKFWGGEWLNNFKQIIFNDSNNNETEQIDQTANGIWWENSVRRFFTYNEANLITYANCDIWSANGWTKGDGNFTITNPNGFIAGFITNNIKIYYSNISGVNNKIRVVNDFSLSQNYPNPFNPSTTINYFIPKASFVSIKVYDILGKEVAELVNEERSAGSHRVQFNANGLASGVYIYSIKSGVYSKSRLMILEK